jgi:hypothetical protein
LAAGDGGDSILIPFDFSGYAPRVSPALPSIVPIVEARVPGLQGLRPKDLSSFSKEGRELAVSALPVGTENVLGTLDGERMVLRIAGGQARLPLLRTDENGAFVIPQVTAAADPDKIAVGTPAFTGRRAFYETNDAGKHQLWTFDLTVPFATPQRLDELDGRVADQIPDCPDFRTVHLGPGLHPYEAYRIFTSDSLVGFLVPRCFGFGTYRTNQLRKAGAYDLSGSRVKRVLPEHGSHLRPLAVDDDLLVYSTEVSGGQRLFVHRAGDSDLPLRPRRIAPDNALFSKCHPSPRRACPSLIVTNRETSNDVTAAAVSHGRVAYVVDETITKVDLLGHGLADRLALFLLYPQENRHVNLRHAVARPGRVVFNGDWVAAEVPRNRRKQAVAVFDATRPAGAPRIICDGGPGPGYLASAKSDSFIACAVASSRRLDPASDHRWSRRFRGRYLLHVFVPSADHGSGSEVHLGLAVDSPYDVQAQDSTLVVGMNEPAQCADVGDGQLDRSPTGGGPYAVYVYDTLTTHLVHVGPDVVVPQPPLLLLQRNFADKTTLTIVTGEDAGNVEGETVFLPAGGVQPLAEGVCASDGDCNDGDPCTVDKCNTNSSTCEFTPLPGVGGVDCALGRLLAHPLCEEDYPLPPRLGSAIQRHAAKAVAALPRARCPLRTAPAWGIVRRQLAAVARNVGGDQELLLDSCVQRLRGLVAAAQVALDNAASGPTSPSKSSAPARGE